MSSPRNSFDVVRYDWLGVRIGGPGASMHGLWPVLIVAMLVVFGCFFALGRISGAGGSPKQGSSAAPVARAAVPGELRGGTPVPAKVPSAIAEPPRTTAPAKSTEAVHAAAPFATAGGTATTTTSAASQTEAALARQTVPVQAPTQPAGSGTPAGRNSSSPAGSAGGAKAGAGAAGSGSFDTSE